MKQVTLSGGFHNAKPIHVRMSDRDYDSLKAQTCTLSDILTDHQTKKLSRHFCGVRGCTCGGVNRATIEFE